MAPEKFTTPSGKYLICKYGGTQLIAPRKQHHQSVLSKTTEQWVTLVRNYARYRKLWTLRVEDAESKEGDWSEIFWNPRIKRKVKSSHLEYLVETMVSEGYAFYEPPRQTQAVIVCWHKVEEWAEILYSWVSATGQFNTILTYYEIQNPVAESALSDIPIPLLLRAIQVLVKSGRGQQIEGTEGGGVRFFALPAK